MGPPSSLPTRLGLSGLAGCFAASLCHPLDVVRVQMQTGGGGSGHRASALGTARRIWTRGGVRALWAGLSAAYMRQWTYTATRMGLYSFLLERCRHGDETVPPFHLKLVLGSLSGAVGSFVGTPSEIALVRMADDSRVKPCARRNYRHSLDCVQRIAREEGLTKLWRGATPTILRASVLNAFQLGCYSQAKEELMCRFPAVFHGPTTVPTMFVGSMMSAFFGVGASMPLDVAKSRLQSQPATIPLYYQGMLHCLARSVREEGLLVLWKGFVPAYVKLAPYTCLSFMCLETLTRVVTGSAAL